MPAQACSYKKKLPSSSPQSNGLSKFSILWFKNNTYPVEVTPYFDFFKIQYSSVYMTVV